MSLAYQCNSDALTLVRRTGHGHSGKDRASLLTNRGSLQATGTDYSANAVKLMRNQRTRQ